MNRRDQLLGGRYRLQKRLGEGGMASVYLATDEKLSRKVAVKILHRHLLSQKEVRRRFYLEAKAISMIDHPNILKVYDYSGDRSEDVWIVTEVLKGLNLGDYLRTFPSRMLNPLLACLIVNEILKALEAVHRSQIVHRDIKPDNIFILDTGGVKLMDFGIAKNLQSNSVTSTGTFMGSPNYMSPEQIKSQYIDHRSDIYSLGVLFYEIITGEVPFKGHNTPAVVMKICEGRFYQPKDLVAGLPDEISRMIVKAMSIHPTHRFQSASQFSQDLEIFCSRFGLVESSIELERYRQNPALIESRMHPVYRKIERKAAPDFTSQQAHYIPPRPGPRNLPKPVQRVISVHRSANLKQWSPIIGYILSGSILVVLALVFMELKDTIPQGRSKKSVTVTKAPPKPRDLKPVEIAVKESQVAKPPIKDSAPPRPFKRSAPVTKAAPQVPQVAALPPTTTKPPESVEPRKEASPHNLANTPGSLRISSQPAARIFIDNSFKGTTVDKTHDSGIISLPEGKYQLSLRRQGYQNHNRNIEIKAGSTLALQNINLVRLDQFAVKFESSESDLQVIVTGDGIREQFQLSGSHTLELKPGFYRVEFFSPIKGRKASSFHLRQSSRNLKLEYTP
jgi:serine/threonine protein kinase